MKQTKNTENDTKRLYQEAVALKGGGLIGNYRVVSAMIDEVVRPSSVEMMVAGYIIYQLGAHSIR